MTPPTGPPIRLPLASGEPTGDSGRSMPRLSPIRLFWTVKVGGRSTRLASSAPSFPARIEFAIVTLRLLDIPPPSSAEFPEIVLEVTVTLSAEMPPPEPYPQGFHAQFPEIVLELTFTLDAEMPPPNQSAEFPEIVLEFTVTLDAEMPPPKPAEFPEIVLEFTVTLDAEMPPPLPPRAEFHEIETNSMARVS